jgi:hypothetical protein
METKYSILTAIIRPEIQERIAIGLLLIGEGTIQFNYSRNKVAAVKNLLQEEEYKLFKDYLKLIVNKATENVENLLENQLEINNQSKVFSEEYIHYLSRYNNNLLSFTPPKIIDLESNKLTFDYLYGRFIDNLEEAKQMTRFSPFESFKQKNEVKLINHFNIEKEVTNKEIANLIAPVKVDLLGKNEIPVYAQTIDLEKNVYHIENDLAQLLFLRLALTSNHKKVKEFVITSEPNKKALKQHQIWENLRSTKEFEYIDSSEAEKVIEYAEKHGVMPLVK